MKFKRILSLVLAIIMAAGVFPVASFAAANQSVYTLNNGYIKAEVSAKNGGFYVGTVKGNKLKKSDDNKNLLYHDDEYDTSFISFRVTEQTSGETQDYIFGGKYGSPGDRSRHGVSVSQSSENEAIQAVWGTGDLVFTLTYTLANQSSNEHGMISLSIKVENTNSQKDYDVDARILYDTALGEQDCAYYQISQVDQGATQTNTYTCETVLDQSVFGTFPQNFYAADSLEDPSIVAYTAAGTSTPYRIAIAHWNNLAASLFDFTADPSMEFINPLNEYLTADSAIAMYYELGTVAASGEYSFTTFYGVYSNSKISTDEKVAINLSAPTRLELNSDKTGYAVAGPGVSNFSVAVSFENYQQEGACDYSSLALAITSTSNLKPLTSTGTESSSFDYGYTEPYTVTYQDMKVGDTIDTTVYFKARMTEIATYEKITIGVYDTSKGDGSLSTTYLLGEKTIYILLPAGDGSLPKLGFVSMSPNTIYCEGTRHMYISLTNGMMLENKSLWYLWAVNTATGEEELISRNDFTITENVMDVVISEYELLTCGSWQLEIRWQPAAISSGIVSDAYKVQTADCLMFTVSDDVHFKNECYGVAAIVRFDDYTQPTYEFNTKAIYRLKTFADEAAFEAYKEAKWEAGDPIDSNGDKIEYTDILLYFKGLFTLEEKITVNKEYSWGETATVTYPIKLKAVSTKSIDPATNKSVVDNCITISDCLDFEDGDMTIEYDYDEGCADSKKIDNTITVDFDGDVLTSIERTHVWTGPAGFNQFVQGKSYKLLKYKKDGTRNTSGWSDNDAGVCLAWPLIVGQIGQTIAGMVFKLTYGEMGVIYDSDTNEEKGRVIAFSASFTLPLSVGDPEYEAANKDNAYNKLIGLWYSWRSGQKISDVLSLNEYWTYKHLTHIDESPSLTQQKVTTSIMVQDILFGCGRGFYGLHFSVGVTLANIVDGLPNLSGTLEVNTINDWSFAFAGQMKVGTIMLEAKLSCKNIDNVPVPDSLYFYIGGFKPGVNVDGFGIIWITGGGGGFDKLYETILCTQSVPPLKLIMSLSFSLFQVLDGRATLKLGLTGFDFTADNIKVFGKISAIKRMNAALEWYPGIDAKASINILLFETMISGKGYLVLKSPDYKNYFFEMFARANLKLPASLPGVGGMDIAGVDLGINSEKIWGSAYITKLNFGITYYWGADSVDFGGIGTIAQPTYPELLLGIADEEVYYDEEENESVRIRFGTNVSSVIGAELCDDNLNADGELLGTAFAKSNASRTFHKFNLGLSGVNDSMVRLDFDASSLEDARAKAATFTVKDDADADYPITVYDASANNGQGNFDDANANVTYNGETGKASFTFTAYQAISHVFNKDWNINTGSTACELMLYNVDFLPEMTDLYFASADGAAGSDITVSWTGDHLSELDEMTFFLSETNNPEDAGTQISVATGTNLVYSSGSGTFTVPANTPAGDYYVKCVCMQENTLNSATYSKTKIHITNANEPADMTLSAPSAAGDLKIAATATVGANTEGIQVGVYEADASGNAVTESAISGIGYDINQETSASAIEIGGSYICSGAAVGLTAGTSYVLVARPYNTVDTNGDGTADSTIYGKTVQSLPIVLADPTTPVLSVISDKTAKQLNVSAVDGSGSILTDTYTEDDISFSVIVENFADDTDKITGYWQLDGALKGEANYGEYTSAQDFNLTFADLTDGEHTLVFAGKDAEGDGFRQSYSFTVDTQAPKLVVSSPLNGQVYTSAGAVNISALTDADAVLTVSCNGAELLKGTPGAIGTYNAAGLFTTEITVPDPLSGNACDISIKAEDAAGNYTGHSAYVYSGAIAGLCSVDISVDGYSISDGNITADASLASVYNLTLLGNITGGAVVSLGKLQNIRWTAQAVSGSISVNDDGVLTVGPGAQGIVTGGIEISNGVCMTQTLTIGAHNGNGYLETRTSLGGSVSGGGQYNPGDTVSVTAAPCTGYRFAGWTAKGITLGNTSSSTISITIPATGNVTLTAKFEPVGGYSYNDTSEDSRISSVAVPSDADENTYSAYYTDDEGNTVFIPMSAVIDGKLIYRNNGRRIKYTQRASAFKDVSSSFKDDVNFLYARGLINGVNENEFNPGGVMTREMLITVLYRLSGCPEASSASSFTDVDKGSWYADAVAWAEGIGLTRGCGDGTFGVNKPVTKEDLCTFAVNYIKIMGCSIPNTADADEYSDEAQIADYASDSVLACSKAGIASSASDGVFMPKSSVSRAECCSFLADYITAIMSVMK